MYKLIISCITFCILFYGCNSEMQKNDENTTSSIIIHKIINKEIDSDISNPELSSFSGVKEKLEQKNGLLVFLGGTKSMPQNYSLFSKLAAKLGYHVIVLNYPNNMAVGEICKNQLKEYGEVRKEMITGLDTSALIDSSYSDSIINRISKTLSFLNKNYSDEGWDEFFSSKDLNWSKITMAGFSQGAGHALWMAKYYKLKGAIIFSGVVDGRTDNIRESAYWISENTEWKTPKETIRYFVSTNDLFYPSIKCNLISLDNDPDKIGVSIDKGVPLERGKIILMTSALVRDNSHSGTVEDSAVPFNGNSEPIYFGVWKYLLSDF